MVGLAWSTPPTFSAECLSLVKCGVTHVCRPSRPCVLCLGADLLRKVLVGVPTLSLWLFFHLKRKVYCRWPGPPLTQVWNPLDIKRQDNHSILGHRKGPQTPPSKCHWEATWWQMLTSQQPDTSVPAPRPPPQDKVANLTASFQSGQEVTVVVRGACYTPVTVLRALHVPFYLLWDHLRFRKGTGGAEWELWGPWLHSWRGGNIGHRCLSGGHTLYPCVSGSVKISEVCVLGPIMWDSSQSLPLTCRCRTFGIFSLPSSMVAHPILVILPRIRALLGIFPPMGGLSLFRV